MCKTDSDGKGMEIIYKKVIFCHYFACETDIVADFCHPVTYFGSWHNVCKI